MAASSAIASDVDVESFIHDYYDAWGGTDEDRILSYYAEDVVLQIPGLLMQGKEAVRDQFARPFITAFPGNRHFVKKMIFGPGVVTVEFSFEAQHKGPLAGHPATGAQVKLPGCGVYEYDLGRRQITAGRIYFDLGTLLQTITDSLVSDRKKAEEALRTSERNLSLITNAIPTFVQVLRSDGSVLYVNQAALGYTGLTLEDVRKEDYRARVYHPEDVERLREERGEALTRPVPFENEQRMLGKDGKYRWFLVHYNPLLDTQGKIDRWYVTAFDIDDRKRTEWLRSAEMRTLQMIADGASLTDILDHVCTSIDAYISPRFTSITLMDPEGKRLWPTAGPKVPKDWVRAITPLPVAADTGLCGTAACLKARVIVPDVATEPIWEEEYRGLAIKNGIRAAWSQPILAKENEVLGTLGVYSSESSVPTAEELALIEAVARIALIAIERQRSQQALRNALELIQKSESKLRQVIDAIPALAWCMLPDGANEFLNQGWHEYTGLSPEQSHGWGWKAAFHPDDLSLLIEKWQKMLLSGESGEIEVRLRRHDGVYRWFLIRAQAFRDESGKIVRWYGTSTDIDDRKRAEDAQARQTGVRADVSAAFSKPTHLGEILRGCTEAIVRHLDAAFARIWLLSKHGSVLELRASAGIYTRLDGSYSRIPMGDLKVGCIALEKKAHLTNDVINDPRVKDRGWAQSNGMVAFAGYPLVVEDRLIGVLAMFARHPLAESILDTLASVADMIAQGIERKRAEEELRASESFLVEGQRLSHTGSWAWNASTGKLIWSEEHFRILGLDPRDTELSLDVFWEKVHPDDRVGLQRTFESAIREKRDLEQEFRIVTANGCIRYLYGVGHAILNEAGELTEFIGSTMDITERKSAETGLEEARAELERVTRVTTMGELAASIAHEINQPLAGVVTSANAGLNWLAANPPNLSKTREALERVRRDGTRGGEVLARIRALLKRTAPAKTFVSVNQIVGDVFALITGELRQNQIDPRLDLSNVDLFVLGDAVQLQQVLLNLIKNAIESMAAVASGPRTLRIQSRLGELNGKPAVVIEVSDTGAGFSSADSSRLFEAFHTTKPQGMGMGLWISRSIIENHQGRLTASSDHGSGATFAIMLPSEDQEQA
jgi:PAS domain S-box-containing protein